MSDIAINMEFEMAYTPIPNNFIDYYMGASISANPIFVVVYMFFYKNCYNGNKEINAEYAAKKLGILESDVINALKHWNKQNIIEFKEKDKNISIKFKIVEPVLEDAVIENNIEKNVETNIEKNIETKNKPTEKNEQISFKVMETKPNYSLEELDIYRTQSEEIKNLFIMAENVLSKLLTYNDMNILFSLYDWLRLPIEVIEVLMLYCAGNEHRNMRYIEKAAIDWAENNINTIEKADEYIKLFNKDYRQIMKAFGISDRNPTATETNYMKKWLKEFELPLDVILEACDQTIMRTGKSKFTYADKIIIKWHENNVKTIEDIKRLEEEFYQEKDKADVSGNKAKRGKIPVKQNGFINFKQREWDFEDLEKKLFEANFNTLGNAKNI